MTYNHNTLFKALNGITSPNMGYRYPVGRWTKHLDPAKLAPCEVGYHLARGAGILPHLESGLYVAEPCPDHGLADSEDRLLTCRVRLTRVKTWNERTARLWAADVAEAALLSERASGQEPDERSWAAVRAVRSFADGLIGSDELQAAEDSSWKSTSYAALAATRSANIDPWMAAPLTVLAATRSANIDPWMAAPLTVLAATSAVGHLATDAELAIAPRSPMVLMFDRLLMYLNGSELPPVEPLYGPAMEVSAR